MKGGIGMMRGSGGDSPQKAAAAKPIGSPAAWQAPKLRRAGKGAGDAAQGGTATPPGLADVAIHTPPRLADAAGGGEGGPGAGCTADEVLAYVLRSERAQKELVEDLEQRTAEHVNQFR